MQIVCSILLHSGYVGAAYVLKIRNNDYIKRALVEIEFFTFTLVSP